MKLNRHFGIVFGLALQALQGSLKDIQSEKNTPDHVFKHTLNNVCFSRCLSPLLMSEQPWASL